VQPLARSTTNSSNAMLLNKVHPFWWAPYRQCDAARRRPVPDRPDMPQSVRGPADDGPFGHTGGMSDESPKAEWATDLPAGPPMREELARLVESDGGCGAAENGYFEAANDPQFMRLETAQRRFRSQLRRRIRHMQSKTRGRHAD
jgi:hypothetical protein